MRLADVVGKVTGRFPRSDFLIEVLHQDTKTRQNVGKHLPIDTGYHPISSSGSGTGSTQPREVN